MYETIDTQPDHIQLRNLFRQVHPSYLVAAGPNSFLERLVQLLDVPDGTGIDKFKVNKSKKANADTFNVSFYPFNRKGQQEEFRKKIYELDLPGLPADSSKNDRQIFIDSMFPMNQELPVIALGNLLKYLRENHLKFNHAFLNALKNLIVTNVLVFNMESQVLLDETTFDALNIFSNIYHPSSFKAQVRHDGLSLFNLLNQCSSSVAVQELKSMLKQPIRDILELNLRFSTIEWCLKPENFDHVVQLREYLKNLLNVSSVFSRIIMSHGRSDWKSLKKTVYYSFLVCEMCAAMSEDSIRPTFLCDLAGFARDELSVKGVLYALDRLVDLDGIDSKKRFMVKEGQDEVLDQKRENLAELKQNYLEMDPDQSLSAFSCNSDQPTSFRFQHFPEMGFVIGTELKPEDLDLSSMAREGVELVLQTIDATYFRTTACKQLNDEYEVRMTEIIQQELRIFNRLISYIKENMANLIDITKLCAKLDVLISFASVSRQHKYVKPVLVQEKELNIVNGRHPLVELTKPFVPSTTLINEANRNFINIIQAPNASGKSVYMKKIASICYLAHIGMFVPADSCTISLLHSIFTRIYTPESMYQCESAFMTDLQQMSKVIMNSTNRSLILIDEFGKGTLAKDGLALLAASIEHFVQLGELAPIAFITTHYSQVSKYNSFVLIFPVKLISILVIRRDPIEGTDALENDCHSEK